MGEKINQYLSVSEVTCNCGCGKSDLHPDVAHFFYVMRELFGEAIIVTSGCRCAKHNKACGGTTDSYHLKGMAVDVTCKYPTAYRLSRLEACGVRAGFNGVGIGKGFIHFDIRRDFIVFSY